MVDCCRRSKIATSEVGSGSLKIGSESGSHNWSNSLLQGFGVGNPQLGGLGKVQKQEAERHEHTA